MKDSISTRWVVITLVVLLLASGLLEGLGAAQDIAVSGSPALRRPDRESLKYVAGELLVKFKNSPSAEVLTRNNLILGERLDGVHENSVESQLSLARSATFLTRFESGRSVNEVAAQLGREESVEYAEPNYIYPLCSITPNDPMYFAPPGAYAIDGQWGHQRIGMESVWPEKSRTDTVVINLDTGVDLNHQDLRANLWVNPGEVVGNGVDDDRNGFADDVYGWDFVLNRPDVSDVDGHGTKIAGLGARGNNGIGVAGVSWDCRMMTLRTSDSNGAAISAVISAIRYATATLSQHHQRGVFNASFAGPGRSQTLYEAIRDSGALLVAASGNYGISDPTGVYYPAAFNTELPNVLSVTSSSYNADDGLVPGASSQGADIAAPGAWVMTTERGGTYAHEGGTSLAAPYVAHALAMMLDVTNGDTSAARARILKSVDTNPALSGKVRSGGRLNVDRAFHGIFNPNHAPTAVAASSSVSTGEGQEVSLSVIASDPDGDLLSVSWDLGDGTHASGSAITHAYALGNYQALAFVSDGVASVTVIVNVTVTDALSIGKVKLKGYDAGARTVNKLVVIVTDSRQGQTPRPVLTIVGMGDITFDEESQTYYFAKKRVSNLPSALTIRSSLGGEATRPWQ